MDTRYKNYRTCNTADTATTHASARYDYYIRTNADGSLAGVANNVSSCGWDLVPITGSTGTTLPTNY